jgi:hypothetical protein
MAYTIPVVALLLDEKAAAAAINEPPDYFTNFRNYNRYDGVEKLQRLTGAPIQNFSDENQEFFYVGIQVTSDWRIDIDAALLKKAAALKQQYDHPLVQAAQLSVVSEFC